MKKKTRKPQIVEEAQAAYGVEKSSGAKASSEKTIRYADARTAEKLTKEILHKHRNLFRRLAE